MPTLETSRRGAVTVARALGSSTRAGIYDHLRAAEAALTVRDVAEAFDLHPNVARTHLGLLADAGLVTVGRRKHPGGGRPAKIYRAREDVGSAEQGALDAAGAPPGGAAAALVTRLLVGLVDARGGAPAASRAHDAAMAEARRLVEGLPAPMPPPPRSLEAAAQIAVRALRPYAAEARVQRAGRDWAEIGGTREIVTLVERVDPALGEAIERGLLVGACAAAGVPVTMAETASAAGSGSGRVWRLEAAAPAAARTSSVVPASRVDARGLAREAGVVEAMRRITRLSSGDVLEVLAEGPGAPAAFARWADRAGHVLLGVERAVDADGRPGIRLLIRKGR